MVLDAAPKVEPDVRSRPAADGGKPLRADAQRNRARVLAAAEAAFFEEGVSVPLDEIARRAGVGPGTVYRHFPNKEVLFEAVYVGRVERLTERARELADSDDPGGVFFGFVAHMVNEGSDKRVLVDAMIGAGIDVSSVARSVTDGLRVSIGELLTRAQAVGVVRSDVGVWDIMRLVAGMAMTAHLSGTDARGSDRALAVVCDGLRAIPGDG